MDRVGANAGVMLAGLALVGAVLPWPDAVVTVAGVAPVAVAAAGTAFAAFLARKHGRTGRATGATLAGVASLAALAYAGYAGAIALGGGATPGVGIPVAAAGGTGGLVAAYADWRAVPADQFGDKAVAALKGTAVGLAGYLAIVAWTFVLSVPLFVVVGDPSPATANVVGTLALGLGTATTALAYLEVTDRSRAFFDLRWPTRREVGYAFGGVPVLFGGLYGIQALFAAAGVQSAPHGLTEVARETPEILLVLIPASFLVVGPGEELLFRNVVQKSLYDEFSRPAAIVVASTVFAAVHFTAFLGQSPASTLASLAIVFTLSLVLGALYARTDNLLVPAVVHGAFNAIQFALLYVEVTG